MRPISNHAAVNRIEFRWALSLAMIVGSLSTLPYLFATLASPPGLTFAGVLINPLDGNSYLAKIRQGYEGGWLYHLAYSPEQEPGILVYTLYLAVGHVARLTGWPIIGLYHSARVIAGVLLLLGVYYLAAELTPNTNARRWACATAGLASGLGILFEIFGRAKVGQTPVDFYAPESNTFFSILTNPHFPLATAFEVLVVLWVIKPPFARWPEGLNIAVIAVLGLGLISMAPYLGPVIGIVVVAGLAVLRPIDRKAVIRVGVLATAMLVLLSINFWQLQTNPGLANWLSQTHAPSQPLLDTLLSFGIWLPLALAGAYRVWQSQNNSQQAFGFALLAWIVITLVLLYVPYDLQHRFVLGVFAPIAMLAGVGLDWILNSLRGPRFWLVLLLTMGLGFNSNAIVVAATFTAPRQAQRSMYLTNDEVAMFKWLEPRVTVADVVLADQRLGNFVPAWTAARTVFGHISETTFAGVRLAEVNDYYTNGPIMQMLDKYNVLYVIGGQKPRGWNIVYKNKTMTVYGR